MCSSDLYPKLTEPEIKTLIVDNKWFDAIWSAIESEIQRLTHNLANRVRELEERYAMTLPELKHAVEELNQKVEAHLNQMGVGLA